MESIRKPFQGIINIILFNWHFYAIAITAIIISITLKCSIITLLLILGVLPSLIVSYYVYDYSNLYTLKWLDTLNIKEGELLNIHAGFDETSLLIQNKYTKSKLTTLDFYDENSHTEISIKRARKRYKTDSKTIKICTNKIPFKKESIATIFLIFSAHEIRNQKERNIFFKELHRVLKPNGNIIITEHLRDASNFTAYNIGFLHFLSKNTWLNTFKNADLIIEQQIKITPFITTYKLSKHGSTS